MEYLYNIFLQWNFKQLTLWQQTHWFQPNGYLITRYIKHHHRCQLKQPRWEKTQNNVCTALIFTLTCSISTKTQINLHYSFLFKFLKYNKYTYTLISWFTSSFSPTSFFCFLIFRTVWSFDTSLAITLSVQ